MFERGRCTPYGCGSPFAGSLRRQKETGRVLDSGREEQVLQRRLSRCPEGFLSWKEKHRIRLSFAVLVL